MDKELFDRLIKAGVPEVEATEIAKGYRVHDPNSVDVDALTKAMQDIKNTFAGELPETPADIDISVSAADGEEDIVKAISTGADRILEQSRSHIQAREEAQSAILARLDVLNKGLAALGAAFQADKAAIAKGLQGVQDELGTPNRPRAQVTDRVIPAPADSAAAGVLVPADVIHKALTQMQKTDDTTRQGELRRAIARLESGVNPHAVVNEFNIDLAVV